MILRESNSSLSCCLLPVQQRNASVVVQSLSRDDSKGLQLRESMTQMARTPSALMIDPGDEEIQQAMTQADCCFETATADLHNEVVSVLYIFGVCPVCAAMAVLTLLRICGNLSACLYPKRGLRLKCWQHNRIALRCCVLCQRSKLGGGAQALMQTGTDHKICIQQQDHLHPRIIVSQACTVAMIGTLLALAANKQPAPDAGQSLT